MMHIQIFTTGGTFDKIYYDALSEFQIGDSMVPNLLEEAQVRFTYDIKSLVKKDSLELTDEDRMLIHQQVTSCSERLILITHGTDTMTQTANVLSNVSDKVIVLTGAMQPARMRHSDASFNLGLAIGAVQLLPEGVYIAMSGQIFNANQVKKNRAAGYFEATSKSTHGH